jgi:hypothetical protein
MLSKIKQRIAEKKEAVSPKEVDALGENKTEALKEEKEPVVSKEAIASKEAAASKEAVASKEAQEESSGKRLAEIRKRLATQKISVSAPAPNAVPASSPTTPLRPTSDANSFSLPPLPPRPSSPGVQRHPESPAAVDKPAPTLPSPSSLPPKVDSDPPAIPTRTSVGPKPKPKARSVKAKYSNVVPDLNSTSNETSPSKSPVEADVSPKNVKPKKSIFGLKEKLVSSKGSKEKEKTSPKKKVQKKREDSKSPNSSPEKKAQSSPKKKGRANFLNMRVRPLPPLPGHSLAGHSSQPDHDEDDYERFSMDDSYMNYPQACLIPAREVPASSASSVRRWSSFGSTDAHSTTKKIHSQSVDVPDYIDGYVNTFGAPMASSSKGPVGIDRRPLPRIPTQEEKQDEEADKEKKRERVEEEDGVDRDYDYPNLHGAIMFRSGAATKEWMKRIVDKAVVENMPKGIASLLHEGAQQRLTTVPLKDQNEDAGLGRTYSTGSCDYVPMDGEADYVNDPSTSSWLPARAVSSVPATAKELQSEQYAEDDITVYMNLPTPSPQHHISATLPRRPPQVTASPVMNTKTSPAPVSAKRMTKSQSEDPRVPPAKLPKPQKGVVSPGQVSALETKETPRGWISPSQSNQLLSDDAAADYQNIDLSQSLPVMSHGAFGSPTLATPTLAADWDANSQLPPRNIRRDQLD